MMIAVLDGDPDAAEAHMHSHIANSLGRQAIEILTSNGPALSSTNSRAALRPISRVIGLS